MALSSWVTLTSPPQPQQTVIRGDSQAAAPQGACLLLSLRDLQWESLSLGAGSSVGVGESAAQRVPDGKPVEAHGEKAPGLAPHSSSCHPLTRESVKIPSHQEGRSVLAWWLLPWVALKGLLRQANSMAAVPCPPTHILGSPEWQLRWDTEMARL